MYISHFLPTAPRTPRFNDRTLRPRQREGHRQRTPFPEGRVKECETGIQRRRVASAIAIHGQKRFKVVPKVLQARMHTAQRVSLHFEPCQGMRLAVAVVCWIRSQAHTSPASCPFEMLTRPRIGQKSFKLLKLRMLRGYNPPPRPLQAFQVDHRKMTLQCGDLVLYDSRTMHCGGACEGSWVRGFQTKLQTVITA